MQILRILWDCLGFDKWCFVSGVFHTGLGVFIGYLVWGG